MKKYILTQEGEEYARNGLPEVNLLKMLKEPKHISELQKSVKNFAVALQWAKKMGWIKIENGIVCAKKSVGESDLQAALVSLNSGKTVQERQLLELVQRKLATEEKIIKHFDKNEELGELNESIIVSGNWKHAKFREYNTEVPGEKINIGKRQPYLKFISEVKKKMIELGFIEMNGPTIETEFWNFDALFQPQNHPSRDWTQTYSLKFPKSGSLPGKQLVSKVAAAHETGTGTGGTGWGYKWSPEKASQLMPRAHDTAISPRYLSKGVEIPGKYFSIVRCFRPDVIDATHGVEFNQMGGFVIAEGLNFKDLLGLLKMFAEEFGQAEKVKFMTDYFPFTEPSVQLSAKHPDLGWVELGGAGIFREELTKPLGINVPVIAWGIGIERLAMIKLGIKDIRYMFSQNLDWLRSRVV